MVEALAGGDDMTTDALSREFKLYLTNRDKMVEEHDGKVIALKGGVVLGVYDSDLEAVTAIRKKYVRGTVLIQRVSEADEAHTATFNSPRVSFP